MEARQKIKFSLKFQFALYDSLKALTGCLEKLRFAKMRKRFGI